MSDDNIAELAKALAQAQAEIPAVKMDAENPYFKSKYASLGAIIETAKPVLKSHGLSITQFPVSNGNKIGVHSILMHESGQFIEDVVFVPIEEGNKNPAQEAGKIITYLRRYSYAAILGMYADEDTDGGPQPGQKAAPKATGKPQASQNGKNRPLSPEAVRNSLQKRSATYILDGKKASDKQRKLLLGQLSTLSGGDDGKRYTFTRYTLEKGSSKDLNDGDVLALLDWLALEQDDTGYVPCEAAVTEFEAVLNEAYKEEGQKELI